MVHVWKGKSPAWKLYDAITQVRMENMERFGRSMQRSRTFNMLQINVKTMEYPFIFEIPATSRLFHIPFYPTKELATQLKARVYIPQHLNAWERKYPFKWRLGRSSAPLCFPRFPRWLHNRSNKPKVSRSSCSSSNSSAHLPSVSAFERGWGARRCNLTMAATGSRWCMDRYRWVPNRGSLPISPSFVSCDHRTRDTTAFQQTETASFHLFTFAMLSCLSRDCESFNPAVIPDQESH